MCIPFAAFLQDGLPTVSETDEVQRYKADFAYSLLKYKFSLLSETGSISRISKLLNTTDGFNFKKLRWHIINIPSKPLAKMIYFILSIVLGEVQFS